MTETIPRRENQQIQQQRRKRGRNQRLFTKVLLLMVVAVVATVSIVVVSIVVLGITVPSTVTTTVAATVTVNAMIQGSLGRRSIVLSSSGKLLGFRSSAGNSQKGLVLGVSPWLLRAGSSQLHSKQHQQQERNRTARYISTESSTENLAGSSNDNVNSKRIASSSSLYFPENIPLRKWIDLSVPEGRVVGVAPLLKSIDNSYFDEYILEPSDPDAVTDDNLYKNENHWIRRVFHPDEVEFGMTLKKTRTSFWLGRLALRCLLVNENVNNIRRYDHYTEYPPILKDSYGRPDLSSSSTDSSTLFGSISHKKDRGVAILAKHFIRQDLNTKHNDDNKEDDIHRHKLVGVGIDLELVSRPGKASIAKRVLTPNELKEIGRLEGVTSEEEVLLRFSLKEAIYKAIHPLLCQYVSFQEAEVTPYNDGTASCTWLLLDEEGQQSIDEKVSKLTAHWIRLGRENYDNEADDEIVNEADDGNVDDQYFLTSASVFSKRKEVLITSQNLST